MYEDTVTDDAGLTPVVDADTAQVEFDRFAAAMDLEFFEDLLDADELKQLEYAKRRITSRLRSGVMSVDDKGQLVYNITSGGSVHKLEFRKPKGDALMSVDGKGDLHNIKKMYSVLATITKTNPSLFVKMDESEVAVCKSVFLLFFS